MAKRSLLFVVVWIIVSLSGAIPSHALEGCRVNVRHVITEDYDGVGIMMPSNLWYDPVKRETYVLDAGHHRILIYAHDYFPLMVVGSRAGLIRPMSVAIDATGHAFIVQSPDETNPAGRITLLNPCLNPIKDIVFDHVKEADGFVPVQVACHPDGRIYVVGRQYPGLAVLDRDGRFLRMFKPEFPLSAKTAEGQIVDAAVDAAGNLYLLSEEAGQIFVFSRNESFQRVVGEKGGSKGKLARPRGLAIDDRAGRIYVVDYMRHTVIVYSIEGVFLFEFGGLGWSPGWFQYPSDVCVDADGHVVVADTFNNRVQVLEVREE